MNWHGTIDLPREGMVVVCIAGDLVYFGQFSGVDWIECDRDGMMVFSRDGTVVHRMPDVWCELPSGQPEMKGRA